MAKSGKETQHQRALAPWRPASEMERMFEDFFSPRWSPFQRNFWPVRRQPLPSVNIDVYEEKDEIVTKAELPGVKKEDIKVNISDHILTIKGEKKKEEERKDEDYHFSERCYGALCAAAYSFRQRCRRKK
jgi:HSP20 family protein